MTDKPRCVDVTATGDRCTNPGYFGQPVCKTHSSNNKGLGKMVCRVCGKPQNTHKLGYFDHVNIIGMMPAESAATRIRLRRG